MGKALIITGCLCLAFSSFLFKQRSNPVRLSIATYKTTVINTPAPIKTPVSIQIIDLDIQLPLIPADIKNGEWDTTSNGVSYLSRSPVPGEVGNSILYGHNWPSILGRLPHIRPGTMITVYYSDGSVSHFKVVTTAVVSPDQIGILDQTDDRRITLYTCVGFLDSKRFVVVAQLSL